MRLPIQIINDIKCDYPQISFKEKNIDKGDNANMAAYYGVMGVPALVFLKGDNPINSITGSVAKDKLITEINEYLGG
jgi:thioredoxin-related protein